MSTWIKLTSKAIYLMQGGSNQFLEKVDLLQKKDATATPIAGEFSLNFPKTWFERVDSPGTMAINLEGNEPQPTPFISVAPAVTGTAVMGKSVRAPSGEVFTIVDSLNSADPQLQDFRPNQPLNSGILLPRFYIKIDSFQEFSKKLTDHFLLTEFISNTEIANGMDFPYYIPVAIIRLAQAMEQLRAKLGGQPIRVSSGYRSPFYPDYQNFPSKVSAHRFGTAIDFVSVGDRIIDTNADLDFVYRAAFDVSYIGASNRPSGKSSLGFNFAESSVEMGGNIDHAHLDMGYITQSAELTHLGSLLV